jgi:hypothetical protein
MIDWNKWGVFLAVPLSISVLIGGGVELVALGGKIDHNNTSIDSTAQKIDTLSRYVHAHDTNSTQGYLWVIQYTGWLERFAARGGKYDESDPPPRNPPPYAPANDGADVRNEMIPVAAGPDTPTLDK